MTRALLLLVFACSGCSAGSAPRHVSQDDGVSFARQDGWSVGRERATLVLTRPGGSATIAIRTATRENGSQPRSERNVVPAVSKVLAALPGARVAGPRALDSASYPGVGFDVEFAPAGKKGARYQRRYAVLVGPSRIIHVFITARAGQFGEGERAFASIVETIEEEG